MDHNDAHTALTTASFGDDDERYARRSPTLLADGNIAFTPEDGSAHTHYPARKVAQSVITLENTGDVTQMMHAMGNSKLNVLLSDISLIVTDSRVIFVVNTMGKPDEKILGHVRYDWLTSVEFRPKQSFLNDSVIQLGFNEDFPNPDAGSWFHEVEFIFDKTFHPGALALEIARRACAHNLAHGAPEAAHQRLQQMQTATVLPDPPKGDTAMYVIPAFKTFPGGADHIADDTPHVEWTVAESGT